MSRKYDVGIIGAGPGGYVAAIRAAQLGLKVALIEKRGRLGGTCLNVGCIPSKSLLDSSELYWKARYELKDRGISVENPQFDLGVMQRNKTEVVDQLTSGLEILMKKNRVDVFFGAGEIVSPGTVRVTVDNGGEDEMLETESTILATGSVPAALPFLPFDGQRIVDSTAALSLEKVPKRLLVVGAGAIGLELGSVWARLGSEVTVVEVMDSILPGWDLQTSRMLKKLLVNQGMEFHLSTKVIGFEKKKTEVVLKNEVRNGEAFDLAAEKVLVAVGRKPYFGQELAAIGIESEGGRIRVDGGFRTTAPGIYAIGDLIDGPMLAHKAEEDGIACAEIIAGRPGSIDYDTIPGVVYTRPEAASVGKTEEELKGAGVAYEKGSFPFRANGKALATGETDGFVKILTNAETDRILGAHIVGPHASILIAEIVSVMEFGGSAEDLGRTVHAHPTLSEAVREAALSAGEGAIHGA